MAFTSPQTAFTVAVIDLQDQLNHHRMDTPTNAGGFVVDWNSGYRVSPPPEALRRDQDGKRRPGEGRTSSAPHGGVSVRHTEAKTHRSPQTGVHYRFLLGSIHPIDLNISSD